MSRRISAPSLVRQLGAWRTAAGAGPAYRQLADSLRLLILDGRLALDTRLAGERELAAVLGVSRTTVTAAFGLLREQGYLASHQGAGARTRLPTGPGRRAAESFFGTSAPGVLDLATAALPAGADVHRAYAAALAALPAHLPGHGYEPLGLPVLRQVVAERYTRRGLPTGAEQILITHGAQHGLALMLRLLAGPGDRVVIDHPTYPNAIDAILRASCRPVPVALPPHGWDVDGLAAAFRQNAPRIAYLVADYHNPTGRWMSRTARSAIAQAAHRSGAVLVLDETLVDLWLDAPPPAEVEDDPAHAVVRLGSTGKSFWGGLRIGWIRADAQTIGALARVRASLDLGGPILEQLAAATLLADDEPALELRRSLLRDRRAHMLALVAERLPEWRVASPPGGLSLWAELPEPVSTALAATTERYGVRIAAGPRFGVEGAFERFVRLPYTLAQDDLTAAVDRLAQAYGRVRPSARLARNSARAPEEAVF
jgi:DNA-binding transcriptional MocR family regulator